MGLKDRLTKLEGATAPGSRAEVPMEVRIHLRAVDRHRARERGEELPAYSREELEQMHRDDLAEAGGGGVVGILRDGPGWRSPESLDRLDEWEEDARRRLERVEDGEPLEVVYNDDEGEE